MARDPTVPTPCNESERGQRHRETAVPRLTRQVLVAWRRYLLDEEGVPTKNPKSIEQKAAEFPEFVQCSPKGLVGRPAGLFLSRSYPRTKLIAKLLFRQLARN